MENAYESYLEELTSNDHRYLAARPSTSPSFRPSSFLPTSNNGFSPSSSQSIDCDTACPYQSEKLFDAGGARVLDIFLILICLICAGCASGLTQGLLSLDLMELELKKRSGTDDEKKYSSKLIPIIKNHHLLLVTLMLWNASATEALPIFLNRLVPEWVAVIISVTCVLLVGEIIPASILTGPKQLQIAASLTPLVYFVLAVFFVIAYPIAKLLDRVIGHDEGLKKYSRREMFSLVQIQHEEGRKHSLSHGYTSAHGNSNSNSGRGKGYGSNSSVVEYEGVHEDELSIISGAFKFRSMQVQDIMSTQIFMLSIEESLSFSTMSKIFKFGYSRIPVYEKDRNDVVGIILTKDLIFIDPDDNIPLKSFMKFFARPFNFVWGDDKLGAVMSLFQQKSAHMAIVRDVNNLNPKTDPFYEVKGIITLEDIIEEIIGGEIEDETDIDADQVVNRDIELTRRLLLNSISSPSSSLSAEEIKEISSFLIKNVPQIIRFVGSSESDGDELILPKIQVLVERCKVFNCKRISKDDDNEIHCDDILYTRGKLSSMFTLVLSGKVCKTFTNAEDKHSKSSYSDSVGARAGAVELGPWSFLGEEAIVVPSLSSNSQPLSSSSSSSINSTASAVAAMSLKRTPVFIPAYSAHILSEEMRCLCISADDYKLFIGHDLQMNSPSPSPTHIGKRGNHHNKSSSSNGNRNAIIPKNGNINTNSMEVNNPLHSFQAVHFL